MIKSKFQRFQKVSISELSEGDRFYVSGDSKKTPHTFISMHDKNNSYVRKDFERHDFLIGNNTNVFFLRHPNYK